MRLRPRWQWLVPAALLLLALAAAQMVGPRATAAAPTQGISRVDAALAAAMLASNDSLRGQMESLDRDIGAASSGGGAGRLESMAETLNSLRVVSGAVAASGPGVEARVSGRFSAATIRDLVNELKSAGAEAIAVNGHRLTLWSAIYEGSSSVLLDGHELGAVVTVAAIGDPATLAEVLQRRGGLIATVQVDGTVVEVVRRSGTNDIRVPMAAEQRVFVYARSP